MTTGTPTASTDLKRIEQLRASLHEANRAYHVENNSQISDEVYDQLLSELKQLEAQHPEAFDPGSPTHKVGEKPLQGFAPIEHRVPMLSLDNVFNEDEAIRFCENLKKNLDVDGWEPLYDVEFKVDGISIALHYKNWELVAAVTRGDGLVGDNVTHSARAMRGVPLVLPKSLPPEMEIRGEAYISLEDFELIKNLGSEPLANPRAAAVGAVRNLDPLTTWNRKVRFVAHGSAVINPNPFVTHSDIMIALQDHADICNCLVVREIPLNDLREELQAAIRMHEAGIVPFPTDGLVIKVDELSVRSKIGATNHHVKWAIAYKYEHIEKVTRLNAVTFQVGRTGMITPVAELEPVLIDGTTVSRATLHNFAEIKRLDLRLGDTVVIEKAGKIIPRVLRVLPDLRQPNGPAIETPTLCPACKAPTAFDGEYLKCTNFDCDVAAFRKILWYVGKDGLNIEGLGEIWLEQLMEQGFVTCIQDLYRLTPRSADILARTKIGPNRLQDMILEVEKSKHAPLYRLLAALGIPGVGVTTAKSLAERFGSVDRLMTTSANAKALQGDGVGPKVSEAIHRFFDRGSTQLLIADLKALGVNMEKFDSQATSQKLAGQTVLVTGTCSQSRDDVHKLIEQHGGIVAKGFSRKVSLLIVGNEPGSKLAKARSAGILIKPAEDFLAELVEV